MLKRPLRLLHIIWIAWIAVCIAGCRSAAPADAAPLPSATASASAEALVTPSLEPEPTRETNAPTLAASPSPEQGTATLIPVMEYPEKWQDMPVIPEISERTRAIYQRGIELGRDPRAFAIVGDCQSVEVYFLGDFANPDEYALGPYEELQGVIDHYQGSFDRERVAVLSGYNVASVLSPFWADPELCEKHESPLDCEFRRSNPSVIIISMETWWYDRPIAAYAGYMRQVVEYAIERGTVPILATKADNREGHDLINQAVVEIAQEYEVPLWNWWRAAQPLPGHGMQDIFHLSVQRPMYDNPDVMYYGWPVRNLTALQTLDAVWRGVQE